MYAGAKENDGAWELRRLNVRRCSAPLGRLSSQIVFVLGQLFFDVRFAPHTDGVAVLAVVRNLEQMTLRSNIEHDLLRTRTMRVAKIVRIVPTHDESSSCFHQNTLLYVLYQIKKKIVKF